MQDSTEGLQQVGSLEAIKTKVLLQGEDSNPIAVRLELTSESDLFFHYSHFIDENGFQAVQESQKLMVDFPDYPNVLIRMLNNCIKEPHRSLVGPDLELGSTP